MIIFLDMDGVLANFNQHMIDVIGAPFDQIGTSSETRWEIISEKCPDVYAQLEPMPDADDLVAGVVEACVRYGYTPAILTALPKFGRIPKAEKHKYEWVRTRWPVLSRDFRVGPHAVDKQLHAAPGHILIDDSHLNIPQWIAAGGVGILHTTAANSLFKLNEYMEATHGNAR